MQTDKKVFNYYDGWKGEVLTCSVCRWKGKVDEGSREYYSDLFDSSCPKCGKMLAIVSYPTTKEMEDADKQGKLDRLDKLMLKIYQQKLKK